MTLHVSGVPLDDIPQRSINIENHNFMAIKENIDSANVETRYSARVLALNSAGKIPIINAKNRGQIKLPGGGMEHEDNKDISKTALRELSQEAGVLAKLQGELPFLQLNERCFCFETGRLKRLQQHYLFVGQTGQLCDRKLEDDEVAKGYETEWLTPQQALEAMRRAMSSIDKTQTSWRYVQARELACMEAFMEHSAVKALV